HALDRRHAALGARAAGAGGYLMLRECTAPRLSADLSFCMTEGWWRFGDHALRADYALLPAEQ
ncbi:hypothetical protein, partial [Burkholderia gladioli]|uniref:hypothetical protein n=1 Tax=Burkholderia gladioli TaxID=28095 RepID=UPI003F7AC5C1